eukprot:12026895-Alexandrium_andersonii.AAC.1
MCRYPCTALAELLVSPCAAAGFAPFERVPLQGRAKATPRPALHAGRLQSLRRAWAFVALFGN